MENCWEGPAKQGTLFIDMPPGGDLFSHSVARAVSSALGRLTSVFGMGTGGAAPLEPPGSTSTSQVCTIFHKQATPEVGGNCSESRGRPHPSPLPGGVLRLSSNHPSLLPQRGSSAPFVTYSRSRHPRRSGDPEPLLSSTRLENGVPAPAPAARHCCPNRVGALSGLWIPAAARMTRDNRKALSPKGQGILQTLPYCTKTSHQDSPVTLGEVDTREAG